MDDLIPLTESEMIEWPVVVKVFTAYTSTRVAYYSWKCFCGRKCNIAIASGASAGSCLCRRDWCIDVIDMTAIVIEPRRPVEYEFSIVLDRGSSWRLSRRQSVGFR